MIHFEYPNKEYPKNHELIEAEYRKKYKNLVEKNPDVTIIFKWNGEMWDIESPLDLANFHFSTNG